jgi:hypothetical protein
MSCSVVFVDRHENILRVVTAPRELKGLAPAFVGDSMKRGRLFRFEGRIYRPIDVWIGRQIVKVTLDEMLPHRAISYVLKCQRSAGGG